MGQKPKKQNPQTLYYQWFADFFHLAAGEGFEPSQTESESAVLPLHNPAIFLYLCRRKDYYTSFLENVNILLHKNQIICVLVSERRLFSLIYQNLLLFIQIAYHKLTQKLVPVETADKTAGIVVVCYIGGVLRENIADYLVDGVIALYNKRVIDGGQDFLGFRLIIDNIEFACCILHLNSPPLNHILIIAKLFQ